jgi:hypothetical protein
MLVLRIGTSRSPIDFVRWQKVDKHRRAEPTSAGLEASSLSHRYTAFFPATSVVSELEREQYMQ